MNPNTSSIPLPEFPLWEKIRHKRIPISFELELTARCNNDCRHCYINLPTGDRTSKNRELSASEITEIARDAASLGALWCLLSGGEPLLRRDFFDVYHALKKTGLLVSVFTNATLITPEHIEFFRRYPPRDIEVSVYGVTQKTYERVTRKPGSFRAFRTGLDLLVDSGLPLRLKTMALRSNVEELPEIARFCRTRSTKPFRFDPFLHLRYDRNENRNREIRAERLSPEEIVGLERADEERHRAVQKNCAQQVQPTETKAESEMLVCGAGFRSFAVSYDGMFRLCASLWHPDFLYDLKRGSLADAWHHFVPKVRQRRAKPNHTVAKCTACAWNSLCLWCPAHAYLETGELENAVPYFCELAHARAESLNDV